jgi:hypothetical protein
MHSWKLNTPDSKEYFVIFTYAVQKGYVTKTGGLNEEGYGLYLSLLGVLGKTSMYGAPPRKTYVWFYDIVKLQKLELVTYDTIRYNFDLTNKGKVMIEILARCLNKRGIPRI